MQSWKIGDRTASGGFGQDRLGKKAAGAESATWGASRKESATESEIQVGFPRGAHSLRRFAEVEKSPMPSAFGEIRARTQKKVDEFRRTQAKLFEEHVNLESHPGQDVDFLGAFEDTFQGEDSAEMRFKPLGKWFEAKEQVIQRLTGHLEKACAQMESVNDVASSHIEAQAE